MKKSCCNVATTYYLLSCRVLVTLLVNLLVTYLVIMVYVCMYYLCTYCEKTRSSAPPDDLMITLRVAHTHTHTRAHILSAATAAALHEF
jgi:hypothetical protein